MHGRRLLIATLLVITAVLAPVAFATVADANFTQEDTNTSEYSYEELTRTGTQYENAPDSIRYFGDYSSASVRVEPVGPFSPDWEYLGSDATVQRNYVTLRTVRLAPPEELDRELTVVVVSWQKGEKEVVKQNQTVTKPAAINKQVTRHKVKLERGIDTAKIDLPPHYDEAYRVTMWIEEYPDARWTYKHKSIPTSRTVDVETETELWWWIAENVGIWTIGSILVSIVAAKGMLSQAKKGPMKGLAWWTVVLFIATIVLLASAYTMAATFLVRLPMIVGALIGLITLIAFLEAFDGGDFKALIETAVPYDVVSPNAATGNRQRDDELSDGADETATDGGSVETRKDALYEIGTVVRMIKRDDGQVEIIEPGIRSFIARWFADGAVLDITDLKTDVEYVGPFDKKYYVDHEDVESEGALLDYTPPHWSFSIPLLNNLEELDDEEHGFLDRVNWTFVGASALSLIVGRLAFDFIVGMPTLGTLAGVGVILGMCFHAEDGHASIEPAEVMLRHAKTSMVHMQRDVVEAETFEEQEGVIQDLLMNPYEKAVELRRSGQEARSERFADIFGSYQDDPASAEGETAESTGREVSADDD